MTLSTLDILLIIISTLLVLTTTYVLIKYKRFKIRAARRANENHVALLREAKDEIFRLQAVITNLKQHNEKSQEIVSNINTELVQLHDVEKFALEQKKLQAQQSELSDRNKQLWEMSVSIEKERQHIQTLKNEIEEQHRAVTSSIKYAKLIQNAVLPSKEILKESFGDVFLLWRPRDIVSGDFYWMKRISDTVIFTVADCTGHGVPGAFMSMLGVAFLNEICVDFNQDTHPAEILEEMRRKVISTLKQEDISAEQKDGMDMGLCILNLKTMKMQFAGANNGMYHVRGSVLTEYKPIRNPVGIYLKMREFVNYDVDIQHGDYIYMYSDGFADQFSENGQKFTSRQLRELLSDINSKTKIASEQAEILNQKLDEWRGKNEQLDDILIGGYRIR